MHIQVRQKAVNVLSISVKLIAFVLKSVNIKSFDSKLLLV